VATGTSAQLKITEGEKVNKKLLTDWLSILILNISHLGLISIQILKQSRKQIS